MEGLVIKLEDDFGSHLTVANDDNDYADVADDTAVDQKPDMAKFKFKKTKAKHHPAVHSPTQQKDKRVAKLSCVTCRRAHRACNGENPCDRCIDRGIEQSCNYPEPRKRGPKHLSAEVEQLMEMSSFPRLRSSRIKVEPNVKVEDDYEDEEEPADKRALIVELKKELETLKRESEANSYQLCRINLILNVLSNPPEDNESNVSRRDPTFTDCMCLFADAKVVYSNYKFQELFRYSEEILKGFSIYKIFHPDLIKYMTVRSDMPKRIIFDNFALDETKFIRRDRTAFQANMSCHRYCNSRFINVVSVMSIHLETVKELESLAQAPEPELFDFTPKLEALSLSDPPSSLASPEGTFFRQSSSAASHVNPKSEQTGTQLPHGASPLSQQMQPSLSGTFLSSADSSPHGIGQSNSSGSLPSTHSQTFSQQNLVGSPGIKQSTSGTFPSSGAQTLKSPPTASGFVPGVIPPLRSSVSATLHHSTSTHSFPSPPLMKTSFSAGLAPTLPSQQQPIPSSSPLTIRPSVSTIFQPFQQPMQPFASSTITQPAFAPVFSNVGPVIIPGPTPLLPVRVDSSEMKEELQDPNSSQSTDRTPTHVDNGPSSIDGDRKFLDDFDLALEFGDGAQFSEFLKPFLEGDMQTELYP